VFFSVSIVSAPQSTEIKWAGHVECTEVKRNAYRILELKLERNTLLGGTSHRWAVILKAGVVVVD